MRHLNRKNNELRLVTIEPNILSHPHGSCMIKYGNTHVICSATVENIVPAFLRGQGLGWITAEYSMLPAATNKRSKRESVQGKQSGRTQEIQRLIGRSLRACLDMKIFGERQIIIDCDVINADGGTRTAAITGSYVALHLAIKNLMSKRLLKRNPLIAQVAAVSCGISSGHILVDLDYIEDSEAEADANFVFTSTGEIVEVQACAEKKAFSEDQLINMLGLARGAVSELFISQNKALSV